MFIMVAELAEATVNNIYNWNSSRKILKLYSKCFKHKIAKSLFSRWSLFLGYHG